MENRREFLGSLGIDPASLVCGRQTHSANIRLVTENEKGRGALDQAQALPDTDALITSCNLLPLAVFTADCLSVFLYSRSPAAIGIVHAGWKGTRQRIAALTVLAMAKKLDVPPSGIKAAFGPCIRDCCYQVGHEFKEYFDSGLRQKGRELYLDLAELNRSQLIDSGVSPGNIDDSGACTCCRNGEFFSFRREGESAGRMMSVIMLKGQ